MASSLPRQQSIEMIDEYVRSLVKTGLEDVVKRSLLRIVYTNSCGGSDEHTLHMFNGFVETKDYDAAVLLIMDASLKLDLIAVMVRHAYHSRNFDKITQLNLSYAMR